MRPCDVDLLLARAQVGLAFVFAGGFFGLLFLLLLHHSIMSAEELTIVTSMLSVLGTLLALQMNFFYARHRDANQSIPDPDSSTAPPDAVPLVQPKEIEK